jgi:hypothetical protein
MYVIYFLVFWLWGETDVSLICSCFYGPIVRPRMNEWMNEWKNNFFNFQKCGAHGGIILTGENRGTRRKTCPSATLSTTNPIGLTWAQTQAATVKGRQQTTWATCVCVCVLCESGLKNTEMGNKSPPVHDRAAHHKHDINNWLIDWFLDYLTMLCHWACQSSGYHTCFIFGRSQVQN